MSKENKEYHFDMSSEQKKDDNNTPDHRIMRDYQLSKEKGIEHLPINKHHLRER